VGIGKNGQNGQTSTSAKQALLKGNPIARREAALYERRIPYVEGGFCPGVKKRILQKNSYTSFSYLNLILLEL